MNRDELFARYQPCSPALVEKRLAEAQKTLHKKIVVLDDDPTGVQTVHGVLVYTDWEKESIASGFREASPLFFILTNSRGLTAEASRALHKVIAERVCETAAEQGKEFLLVSRGDSTLRGHYPLETEALREAVERCTGKAVDGEILLPFFAEGGRYTANDVHYVAEGGELTPAGETEFAKDRTFGYKSSNLCEWVEEKTEGQHRAESVTSVSLEELRRGDCEGICDKLLRVTGFHKVVVNAIAYDDVKVFVTALLMAMGRGHEFLFRTAAAFVKVLGNIADKPLLTRGELTAGQSENGGLIVVGSHVNKTTRQLERLHCAANICFVALNQHLALDDDAFAAERQRVLDEAECAVQQGKTVAVFTRRERFDLNTGNKEDELRLAVKISEALTGVVAGLRVRPGFIIAKGGITSSDVGTKGLGVKKALVLGQLLQGVPVWKMGEESKFPGLPYVIFPGNVGDENALVDAVEKLRASSGEEKEKRERLI